MNALERRAGEYLAIRRAVGYKLRGYDRVLAGFAGWLDQVDADVITGERALTFAQATTSSCIRQRQILIVIRGFAEYMYAVDPRTEVPAADLLPVRYHRIAPYFYTSADISALMSAARALRPDLRAATYETFIGLLACTGLRYGEAAGLDRSDVDLSEGSLLVRCGKNARSRHVPVHATTVAALAAYAVKRDRLMPRPAAPSFFVTTRGGRLADSSVQYVFAGLRRTCGLVVEKGHGRSPRVHDLRHSFVVRTMVGWYREGVDVQARLPVLSTYLGHVDPKATYWYQQAAPELLSLAAARLDSDAGDPT